MFAKVRILKASHAEEPNLKDETAAQGSPRIRTGEWDLAVMMKTAY